MLEETMHSVTWGYHANDSVKKRICKIKRKTVNTHAEQLRKHAEVDRIDINIANTNDMMLWVSSVRDFIEREKGLKSDMGS